MTRQIIYKYKRQYRLLDTLREIVIGVYDTPQQARHGWAIYEEQGCVGSGMDYTFFDEKVTDIIRGYSEVKLKNAVRSAWENQHFDNERRDSEIIKVIDRYSN